MHRLRVHVRLFRLSHLDQAVYLRMPFYAVANGRETAVFTNWDECKRQVDGFKGAKYKKFKSIEEAEAFARSGSSSARPTPYDRPAATALFSQNIIQSDRPQHPPVQPSSSSSTQTVSQTNGKKTILLDDLPAPRVNVDGFVDVYTDGACVNNGQFGARAGLGVHWPGNQAPDLSLPLDGRQTNNHAEIRAACEAINQALIYGITKLRINTDSQFMMKCINMWIPGWRKNGWKTAANKDVKNKTELIELDSLIKRLDTVEWRHVSAHVGIAPNERADELARNGAARKRDQ